MNRNTILLAALVLLLLVGPLLWLSVDDTGIAPKLPPPAAPAEPRPGPQRPSSRAAAAAAAEEAEAPAVTKTGKRAPRAKLSVVVRVTLEGTEVAPPADTYVKLRMRPDPSIARGPPPDPIELRMGPDPVFDVDATDVFTGFVPGLELDVRADRAGFLPARTRERVSRLASVSGAAAVVPITLRLVLAGEATGVVQDDRSRPAADAAVGSFALVRGRLELVDETSTDDEGRFRVRVRPGEVHVVVVAKPGLLPTSAQVLGAAGAAAPVTGLVLYEGHAIAGRVSVAVAGGPPPHLRVVAFPADSGETFQLGDASFTYHEGRVARCPGTSAIRADGTYRIAGLAPGAHIVSLDCPEMLAEVADSTAIETSAPSETADLALVAAWSSVTVRNGSGPLAQARVFLHAASEAVDARNLWREDRTPVSAEGETDGEGRAWFLAPEGHRYTVRASADGHETARQLATTPFAEAVELRQWPDTWLELRLEPVPEADAVGPVPGRVELRFFDAVDPKPYPAFVRRADVGPGGMCTVHSLPAGLFRVEVVARPQGWYLVASLDQVKLVYAKGAGATVKIVRGGRVHVELRDAAGEPAAGTYQVLDAAGIEHAAGTVSDDPSEKASALVPSGAYRVVVAPAGGPPQTSRATVEVAKTARVSVTAATGK